MSEVSGKVRADRDRVIRLLRALANDMECDDEQDAARTCLDAISLIEAVLFPAPAGKWAIDNSTPSPILTYENCSVIQDEQAYYVLRLIEADAASPAPDVNGAFKGPVDTDDALMMAAREAGWALMELVDGIDWPKREHVARIITTLGDAIASAEASRRSPDLTAVMGEVEKIEHLFPNVDAWGAKEWFQRLMRAVDSRDAAVQSGNDIAFETHNNIASSSATRLAHDYRNEVLEALAALSRIRSKKEPSDADAK